MNAATKDLTDRGRNGRPTLGVEIDRCRMGLVLVHHGVVRAWANVPYPADMTPESAGFPAFLRQAIESCVPSGRPVWIWALGSFPSLQLRFFGLPRTHAGRISNMVYWTFRKELPFDAAQTVFDYDVEGEQAGVGPHGVQVTAYTVQREEMDALCRLFEQAGVQLRGIVIPHFAARNLFRTRWLEHRDAELGVYVGAEASTVQIQSGGHVALSRVFITGMNAILDAWRDRHPEWSTDEAYAQLRAADASDFTEMQEVTRAALGRLMQQVERSMSAFLVGREADEIRRIYVMGGLAAFPRLVESMGQHWGVPTEAAAVVTRARMAPGVPLPDAHEAALLTMAAGVALSSRRATPSLLHTYVKREREHRVHRTRRLVIAAACAAVALVLGGYAAAGKRNQWKAAELAVLNDRLNQYPVELTREGIDRLAEEAIARRVRLRDLSRKSRPLALVGRLASSTPADIRLTAVRIAPPARRDALRSPEVRGEHLAVEGIVLGLPETQESRLAAYVMRLEDDTLFHSVSVIRTDSGSDGMQPVLLFQMAMEGVGLLAEFVAVDPTEKEWP